MVGEENEESCWQYSGDDSNIGSPAFRPGDIRPVVGAVGSFSSSITFRRCGTGEIRTTTRAHVRSYQVSEESGRNQSQITVFPPVLLSRREMAFVSMSQLEGPQSLPSC